MADIKDGGPAFPQHERHAVLRERGWCDEWLAVGGMSLRDYFAGQALAGKCGWSSGDPIMATDLAEEAYVIADAMLKAREGK